MTTDHDALTDAEFWHEPEPEAAPKHLRPLPRRLGQIVLLTIALVAAADLLLFQTRPGLGLFAFAALVAAAIVALHAPYRRPHSVLIAALCFVLLAVPLLEAPSLLSVLLMVLGLGVVSLSARGLLPEGFPRFWALLTRFAVLAPFRLIDDCIRISLAPQSLGGGVLARALLAWAMPFGFAFVFIALFAQANPLIEAVLNQLDPGLLLAGLDGWRIAAWAFVAAFVWPLLVPRLLRLRKSRPSAAMVGGSAPVGFSSLVFGPGAILRALILFNALFAVQTISDLFYLWAGQSLPDGMTYAAYAHRGAYPLVATALLAALFVLVALRPGGAGERSRPIRALVYVFIGQNILLVLSSMLRLDLYVQAYSLTGLRLAAGIWMGLVAVGLALILARIALRRTNYWLISANLIALLITIYASALVDVGSVVSRFNVEHSREAGGPGLPLDLEFLRAIGPTSLPALDQAIASGILPRAKLEQARTYRAEIATEIEQACRDWRCWTLRKQRLWDYLSETDR